MKFSIYLFEEHTYLNIGVGEEKHFFIRTAPRNQNWPRFSSAGVVAIRLMTLKEDWELNRGHGSFNNRFWRDDNNE